MTKYDIEPILDNKHIELFEWVNKQSDQSWTQGLNEKWTVGQHILHIVDVIQLLNKAFEYSQFLLRYKFGKSNRPSRSYDALVKRCKEKLHLHKEKAKTFHKNLRIPKIAERQKLLVVLQFENKKLQARVHQWKNKDLDTLLIPHPLMGKMTMREWAHASYSASY